MLIPGREYELVHDTIVSIPPPKKGKTKRERFELGPEIAEPAASLLSRGQKVEFVAAYDNTLRVKTAMAYLGAYLVTDPPRDDANSL